jgi:hypothetical protein
MCDPDGQHPDGSAAYFSPRVKCCSYLPKLPNFLVGRAYVELKRFHQARVHLQRALLWAESDGAQKNSAREPLVAGAEDRAAVLSELARAEAGLGESTPSVNRRAQ